MCDALHTAQRSSRFTKQIKYQKIMEHKRVKNGHGETSGVQANNYINTAEVDRKWRAFWAKRDKEPPPVGKVLGDIGVLPHERESGMTRHVNFYEAVEA